MGILKKVGLWVIRPFSKNSRDKFQVILLCIIAATIFWLLNALNKDYSTKISYPILFDFDNNETVVLNNIPDKIDMNVTGTGWSIVRKGYGIDKEPLYFKIEDPLNTQWLTSRRLLPILAEQLKGVKINYLFKDTISFNFDKLAYRKIFLALDTNTLVLPKDFEISDLLISPDSIELSGPSTIVSKIRDTILIRINKKILEDFNEEVKILENLNNLVEMDQNYTRVNFKLVPKPLIYRDSAEVVADSLKLLNLSIHPVVK